MDSEQREIWYRGHVQGVGFRYSAVSVAQRFQVTGYVQNLPDGRVHLVAEGRKQELDAFLCAIDDRMGQLIHSTKEDRKTATGQFSEFEIRA